MQIAQVTDLHLLDELADHYAIDSKENANRVLKDIFRRGIREVVFSGDIGAIEPFISLLKECKTRGVNYRYIPGNHDTVEDFNRIPASLAAGDEAYFTAFYRSGDAVSGAASEGPQVPAVFMDSSSHRVDNSQLSWLKDVLSDLSSHYGKILIFIHHPVLDCGNTPMDSAYPLKNREEVERVLGNCGAELYLYCGHYHNSYEVFRGNIHQFVTPSTLLQIASTGTEIALSSKTPGYRIITAGSNGITSQTVIL